MRGIGRAALLLAAACAAAAPAVAEERAPAPPRAKAPPPRPRPPEPYPLPEALATVFGEDYDRALAAAGLDRGTARVTPQDFSIVGYGRFRTALFDALQSDPTLADRYARTLREGAFACAKGLEPASSFAAVRVGAAVRLGLLGDPLAEEVKEAEKEGALEEALRGLDPGAAVEARPEEGLPPPVAAAAALVIRAARRALPWLERALPPGADGKGMRGLSAADASLVLSAEDPADDLRRRFEEEAARADLRYLARASAEVMLAADRAGQILAGAKDAPPFEFRARTSFGEVLLRGGGDDADGERDRGPFLLRMDTGGKDRYGAGAASSPACPLSVLIDLAGDDVYEAPENAPAFGAGFFGIGALLDLGGNDRYVLRGEKSLGLGAGVFGVGALLDSGGDDAYSGVGFCQGAGAVGWGTLCDLAGKDRFDAYFFSQGFGYVLGAGVLTDLAGDDAYVLNDTDIRSPSAQSKEHNSSLGQGFGFGVRADYLDGHSLSGGVGILADREGNDAYSCGVFGQGGGYWMGTGMLLDGAGDDAYSGVWYVQGACAHFAVGILDDAGGNDAYTATMNMAQGAGHDYSLGVLVDRGGNDRYTAPNLSLGGGNADGIGLFVDAGGDDQYRSLGVTLGFSSVATPADAPTLRHGSLTLGVFLDLGGKDSYLAPDGAAHPFAGDGRLWRQAERAGRPPFSNERGVGLDR